MILALILFIAGVSLLSYQVLPPVKRLVDEWVKERNVRRLEKKVNGKVRNEINKTTTIKN